MPCLKDSNQLSVVSASVDGSARGSKLLEGRREGKLEEVSTRAPRQRQLGNNCQK